MEKEQVREWAEAQKIALSVDLVEAAKKHLKFLDVVERNHSLFEDQTLRRAIYRYNAFWLPLLAKHLENPVCEESLVVPVDCELIWHCHRLNPVRYKFDCEKLYGRILGNHNVVSSVQPAKMEKEQAREWAEAQKIALSIDLVEAAKKHLKFLNVVERNHSLFEDQTLQKAIYRYNAFWLPLLAKHLENPVSEESLVVPLDCELIWHCHRLNPVRYKFDCEKLYGRILGNHKVVSSVQPTSKSTTEDMWNKMYPEEPYELDLSRPLSEDIVRKNPRKEKYTSYDLVAAVKRQNAFTYQACRPYTSHDLFLGEALARYKGFLHLICLNRKMSPSHFGVPTFDIDLMWHTHQLYADYYCKDMKQLVGYLVQHNDSDPDKSKGSKLDTGFAETTKQFEQTFGLRYWKAGAMHKGNIPTPVTQVPYEFNVKGKEFDSFEKCDLEIHFPTANTMEVLLEFLDIKNLAEVNKENLLIRISKNQPDTVFHTKRWLGLSSASKEKMFAFFQCEPKGEFLFEVMSYSPSSSALKPNKALKLLGSCSLSIEKLLVSRSQLSTNKWVSADLVTTGVRNSEPVLLHVSMSFSPPMPVPQVFQLLRSQSFKNGQIQAHVMDCSGKNVLSLEKRDAAKSTSDLLTEVYCITDSGEKLALIELNGSTWYVGGNHVSFMLQNNSVDNDGLFQLVGYNKMLKLFPGRRLEFEPKQYENKNNEEDFITAVEFSTDYPYGRGVALINSKLGTIKATDESAVLYGMALAFILSDNLRKEDMLKNEGYGQCTKCHDSVGDSMHLVKSAYCELCKTQMNNEGFGIGIVADDVGQVEALHCLFCVDGMLGMGQMETEGTGSQCIGQCTKCDDAGGDRMDLIQNHDMVIGFQCSKPSSHDAAL